MKGLSRGRLDYSTDDAGRLGVEWVKVARVTSAHTLEIEMVSGAKYLGRIVPSGLDGIVLVEGPPFDTLVIQRIVRMSQLDAGLLQKLKAYFDLGFTFAKANQAATLTMAGNVDYRGQMFGSTLGFDTYAQGQASAATTTRNSADFEIRYFLPDRWSAVILSKAEQNDELNLDYRFSAGGGAYRVLRQSNQSELMAGGGMVVTWEQFKPEAADSGAAQDPEANLEGLLAVSWDSFRFDSPKFDLSASFELYPSLSTPGRFRGEFTTRLQYELFSDFNAGLNFTDTFDSRPPDENAAENDYIATFTIGWSYRR